jgi:hypothetical protein
MQAIKDGLPDCWQTGLRGGPETLFPPRLGEAAMLQERVGHHRHQGVSVKACPGSSLKVVQAQFFLELLMGLLTDPPGLDGPGDLLDRGIARQVREIVFALAA